MRTFLEYAGAFFVGVIAAALVCIVVMATVNVPGPGDHQAGFGMTVAFCVFPLLGIALGLVNLFLLHRHHSKRDE
jgi:Na+/melibiose symporter-like transporter